MRLAILFTGADKLRDTVAIGAAAEAAGFDSLYMVEAYRSFHQGEAQRFAITFRLKQRDGGYRYIRDFAEKRVDTGDGVMELVGMSQDVTQQLPADAMLRESEIKLRRAHRPAKLRAWTHHPGAAPRGAAPGRVGVGGGAERVARVRDRAHGAAKGAIPALLDQLHGRVEVNGPGARPGPAGQLGDPRRAELARLDHPEIADDGHVRGHIADHERLGQLRVLGHGALRADPEREPDPLGRTRQIAVDLPGLGRAAGHAADHERRAELHPA